MPVTRRQMRLKQRETAFKQEAADLPLVVSVEVREVPVVRVGVIRAHGIVISWVAVSTHGSVRDCRLRLCL